MTRRVEGGESWTTDRERGAVTTIRMMVWIALHLGRTATRLLLYPLCLYFLIFSGGSRAASAAYLRRTLGRPPRLGERFRHYHHFAACVLDRVYLLNDQLDLFDVHVEGEELAMAELAHGRGCFLFGAHLGSFEVLRALAHRQKGLKLSLLMYEDNARKINSALNAINPEANVEVIALGRPEAMLTVRERLEAGHFIGVLADRAVGGADQERLRIEFLGAPAPFPLAPFRLAAALRRKVLLMVGLYRGGRRYEVHFETLCDFSTLSRDTAPADIEGAVRRYAGRLAAYCLAAPYNWFNFFDFWI